ncbi:hypothetical protein [Pseudoflavonifractor sp. An85]|uniref:hypothetical protein n=1 Tax=Pseudoflavonifractor sp. An85 TaxID=1965661 RepID=UPI000B3757BD|nr:hypothetical protein [Pseudoflavonifractor sp. An85]OUN22198.1 hypothetical protein B5G37_10115 [Pseudoflavonifractor sp. An85]
MTDDEKIVELLFCRSECALQELESCIPDQKTVEDEMEVRKLARIIEAFLDTLTIKERVIFMRRYAYMDNYSEIAKREEVEVEQ